MATTTPLGFQAPDGGDLIRNGDNAIAANAELNELLHAAEHARLIQLERAAGFSGTGLELADAVVAPLLDQPTSQVRTKLDVRYATNTALANKVGKGENGVFIKDYLAANRVPGVTDDRPAFMAAIATGKRVYDDGGTYYLSATPAWGNNAFFQGAGKGRTVIKLLDTAPAGAILWGVTSFTPTVQGYFADFSLDGNCQRQGGNLAAAGGSQSSTFTLRNSHHFYVDRVSSVNSIQHGFDVTLGQEAYAYVGDGNLGSNRSTNCYFDQVDASNFGDDGFTTHSSDYIHVTRSIFFNPRLRGNCNGIEIDGDSRYCSARGNRTYNCYAGIEVKGHGTESAAQYTTISDHIDTGSVRSYNFRHIGYQTGGDPISLSARGITCTNLVSIDANNDAGFQDDATPRALSISAYQDVTINGFVAKGRGGYTTGDIAVQVQYRASAQISGLQITGWTGAELDISLTTTGKVSVAATLRESSANGVYVGSTVAAAKLDISATSPAGGTGTGLDIYNAANVDVVAASRISGYTTNIRADLTNYVSVAHYLRRFAPVPAGLTSMKALDVSKDYYLSTSQFAACTTDRPTGATGGHFVTHSRMSSDACTQTLTKNTSGVVEQYFRTLYWSNQTASSWYKVTAPAVAYSAT